MARPLIFVRYCICSFGKGVDIPIGGADDEDVFLAGHAVHLREDLVDHAIRCPT